MTRTHDQKIGRTNQLIELLPKGGFRGDDQLPSGGFRGDDQLPSGGFRGDDRLPSGGFRRN
ncbi:MAG: hypothetical protein A2511_12400 [Deltaproteobacteria bacterium RIFOXYD12_FULL_50_9]|nr:MAG: hypothetical protein A2511_12400 [Deltaproteobacteria bacterium RIFOXYD12_FULL_50_9]